VVFNNRTCHLIIGRADQNLFLPAILKIWAPAFAHWQLADISSPASGIARSFALKVCQLRWLDTVFNLAGTGTNVAFLGLT
jgi:hypothetical protein